MDTFLSGTLGAHIIAGTIALLTGPVAMLTLKGGKNHRRWGKYTSKSIVVFVTAAILAIFKDIPFLFMIAFSASTSWCRDTGRCILRNFTTDKKPPRATGYLL